MQKIDVGTDSGSLEEPRKDGEEGATVVDVDVNSLRV